jgi:hypothetical protein
MSIDKKFMIILIFPLTLPTGQKQKRAIFSRTSEVNCEFLTARVNGH